MQTAVTRHQKMDNRQHQAEQHMVKKRFFPAMRVMKTLAIALLCVQITDGMLQLRVLYKVVSALYVYAKKLHKCILLFL